MKCVVTGANGFMGSAVARELVTAGYEVRAAVGADQSLDNLAGLPVEVCEIDLLDPASLEPAFAGVDAVFHTAAIYSFWERDRERIYRVNVGGTRAVIAAARTARVRRLVHTSSTATLAPALEPAAGDEDDVYDAREFQGDYKLSKVMAEMQVLRAGAAGLPVSIVHPTTVLGRGDRRPTPTGSMIVHFLRGHMKAYADTVLNLVDVEDVARGQRLVLEKGQVGQRYILGGDNLAMGEILAVLAELTGLPAARLRLPPRLLLALGVVGEWWADHVSGRAPVVDRESSLHARANHAFSIARARRELGYAPAGARRTLARAVDWFLELGVVDAARARAIRAHGGLEPALEPER